MQGVNWLNDGEIDIVEQVNKDRIIYYLEVWAGVSGPFGREVHRCM
jgi:hypothetical protein